MKHSDIIEFVRTVYPEQDFVPLHAPTFTGNEQKYLERTIQSTFVSTIGEYVDQFEADLAAFASSARVVATVNGTSALHAALYALGVRAGDLIITQALTFVATCNAIRQLGADPVFVDVDKVSMGMCPFSLSEYLQKNATTSDQGCVHKLTGKRIMAVVPMHTLGHPAQIDELLNVCDHWNIPMVEDAAESLGSKYKGRHAGTFGQFGAISFNGNKIITTGGGGAVFCRSKEDGSRLKHITTTAKRAHPFEFYHDEIGFNYRLPNLNAALGVAQLEGLNLKLQKKRQLASIYRRFFKESDYRFFDEPDYAESNFWLNAVVCPTKADKRRLLENSVSSKVMLRPLWTLMSRLPMFNDCERTNLSVSEFFEDRVVTLPSSPPETALD